MNAALGFGCRHSLHAVSARLELQLRVGAPADDAHDHFAVATEFALAAGDDFRLPLHALGVAQVHAQKVAREERRFVAARSGADLKEDVPLVVGILRQKKELDFPLGLFDVRFGCLQLL